MGISLGNGLAGGGFKDELEDLEGVRVLGGGGGDTEGVSSREGNLDKSEFSLYWSSFRTNGVDAYFVGRKADLVVHSDLEERACVLKLQHRGATQVAVGVVTVSECEAIDAAVGFVVGCSVVQESTDTSTLQES